MLTKKLNFDDDTLQVLKAMSWDDNGTLGKISGQLDRALYVKVNKALEAMGGKWDRKAGGHAFKVDPRPMVEGLLESGVLEVARDGFFETPRAVIDRMLELVPLTGREFGFILEPSAGLGAIADVIRSNMTYYHINCVELNPSRAQILRDKLYYVFDEGDFLKLSPNTYYPRIYMNPPFENGQDIDHVKHAYSMLAPMGKLVSVMSEGSFFRSDRKAEMFRSWMDEIEAYSEKLPEGAFKTSGTMVRTRLLVIQRRML